MGPALSLKLRRLLPKRGVVLSALLFFLARPVFSWGWVFSPFIFIPFIIQQNRDRSLSLGAGLKDALWLQFLCGLIWFDWMLPSAQVIWEKDQWFVMLVYAFVCPLFLIHIPLLSIIRGLLLRLAPKTDWMIALIMAMLFTLGEEFFSYMYLSIADNLTGWPLLVSLASLGGGPLLALLVALHMELTAVSIEKRGLLRGSLTSVVFLSFFMLSSFAVSGSHRTNSLPNDSVKINLIQTNGSRVDALEGLKPPYLRIHRGPQQAIELLRNSRMLYPGAQLTILPETIFPFDYFDRSDPRLNDLRTALEQEARLGGTDVIFGAVTTSEAGLPENSSVHLSIKNSMAVYHKYSKRYLMPFSESVPGAATFPWLQDIFFHPQLQAGPFAPARIRVGSFSFGLVICNEIFHPYLFALHQGVDGVVHLGNETWVTDSSGPWLILSKNVLRSIENAVPILKVSNAGLSGAFDAQGQVAKLSNTKQAHIQQLTLEHRRKELTFYAQHPDLPIKSLILGSLVGVTFLLARWRLRRRQIRIHE